MSDMSDAYLRAGRLLLPHGETDERQTYTMPDPDGLAAARDRLYSEAHYLDAPDTITVRRADVVAVLKLAEGYIVLTTYELGQEHCAEKLRDIWRHRRARRARNDEGAS